LFKTLIPACLSLALACTAPVNTTPPPGFLEGHLKIIAPKEVDLGGGDALANTAEDQAEYLLVVLSADGKKEIAGVTVDSDGNYHSLLPPGDYVLDVQYRAHRHLRATPRPFTVASRQTTRVDMEIDTGVR
jgi:hypothetical protein